MVNKYSLKMVTRVNSIIYNVRYTNTFITGEIYYEGEDCFCNTLLNYANCTLSQHRNESFR